MAFPFREAGEGPPLVLLHAFPLSASMWEPNAGVLAAAGYRVIAPDFPGFGKNREFGNTSGIDQMASGIKDLLDSLDVKRAAFVGLSMGGYVLFSLLRQFPSYVTAMALCDTTAGSDTEEKRQGRYELIEKLDAEGSEALVETMLTNFLSTQTLRSNPGVAESLADQFRSCDPNAAAAALRGMALRPDSRDLLAVCDLPAMLIFGEDDKVTGTDAAEELKGLIRRSRLEMVPNAGHYPNLESPERFNKLLISFLKSLDITR